MFVAYLSVEHLIKLRNTRKVWYNTTDVHCTLCNLFYSISSIRISDTSFNIHSHRFLLHTKCKLEITV